MLNGEGTFVLVDGQFGSTGKGLMAAYLSKWAHKIDINVSNGGPNSGHTFYDLEGNKIVLHQLPTMAVAAKVLWGYDLPAYISAGAIINPKILNDEVERWGIRTWVSANAALITENDRALEHHGTIANVAGTRQGVGMALSRKVCRDPSSIVGNNPIEWHPLISVMWDVPNWRNVSRQFVEVSQGFSLGINSSFFPKVTSRECTAMQGLADARIPPHFINQTIMVIRTFPIRVGNVDGNSSGGWYPDQHETTWEEIGVDPELTSTTHRERRVATFSWAQYREACAANQPAVVLANFMQYIKEQKDRKAFAEKLKFEARRVLRREPKFLYGYGKHISDVSTQVR